MKRVVVTGALAYDYIMSMPGRFANYLMADKLHILNVSFTMDKLRRGFGGTAGNIAYGLGLLGTPVLLAAAGGSDFAAYRKHLQAAKLDLSGIKVFKEVTTATGFAMTDRDDNQIWGFYEGAMKQSARIDAGQWRSDDLVMIGPCDPVAMVKYVRHCRKREIAYVFDPAFQIPRIRRVELQEGCRGARLVIGNDYEIELLKRKAGLSETDLLKNDRIVITTLGVKGSFIRQGRKSWRIPAVKVKAVDPSGAGDAYRAGLLAGWVKGVPWLTAGRMAALTAAYAVETPGTQTYRFSGEEFERRYRENFGDVGGN